ncbi:MAG: ribonuclease HII [Syntrophomonadaceae bacterium]|nr:ribonuclease HII [Syntrophomonadaceae bacterium]
MKSSNESINAKELKRLNALKRYEREAFLRGYRCIAGIDEVGRGALAGPVVAAAVILPADAFLPGVKDSKKLSPLKRAKLADEIKSTAISWSIAYVYPPYLDEINILNATREAMVLAIRHLSPLPDYILIDALRLPELPVEQRSIVKGDSLSISIAAASIIAKVERDMSMEVFDALYPEYGFAQHKGYATSQHIKVLLEKGPCSLHRQSFEPVKTLKSGVLQVSLFE